MEIGWKENNKVKENLFFLIVNVMKENGNLEKCMEKVHMFVLIWLD